MWDFSEASLSENITKLNVNICRKVANWTTQIVKLSIKDGLKPQIKKEKIHYLKATSTKNVNLKFRLCCLIEDINILTMCATYSFESLC